MEFIADFIFKLIPNVDLEISSKCIKDTFRAGYCYYFANMLQLAFNRGCICWTAPLGHMVWVDVNGIAYDIEGVYDGNADYLIPIEYMGGTISSFKHVMIDCGRIKDVDEIVSEFEGDLKSGGLKLKDLDYVTKGHN